MRSNIPRTSTGASTGARRARLPAPSGHPLHRQHRHLAQAVAVAARAAAPPARPRPASTSASAWAAGAVHAPGPLHQRQDRRGRPRRSCRSRPAAARIRSRIDGSPSQASSTGRVSLPSCRSWATDLPVTDSGPGAVQDVVGDLERPAHRAAVAAQGGVDGRRGRGGGPAHPGAPGDQRGGLAIDDVEVLLGGDVRVARPAPAGPPRPRPSR